MPSVGLLPREVQDFRRPGQPGRWSAEVNGISENKIKCLKMFCLLLKYVCKSETLKRTETNKFVSTFVIFHYAVSTLSC